MTTQPVQRHTLVLRDPIQLATSIPYLLGFSPDDSIVLTFADETGRHVLTARNDLPKPAEPPGRFVVGLEAICENGMLEGATSVAAVIYPSHGTSHVSLIRIVSGLAVVVPQMGLELLSVSSVREGMWRDELEPAEPAVNLAEAGVATAAEWVARGVAYQGSRAQLSDRIRGPETGLATRVREFIEDQPEAWDREITRNRELRRKIEDDIVSYIERFGSQSRVDPSMAPASMPNAQTLATWVVGLADSRVREPVLWRLADRSAGLSDLDDARFYQMLDSMSSLLRNTPEEDAAPLASCVAAFSWQLGNGAIADVAATYGLEVDPRNVLCQLVSDAVQHGVHPKMWVEMLQAMTLNELRSGPRRRRHLRFRLKSPATAQVRDCPG